MGPQTTLRGVDASMFPVAFFLLMVNLNPKAKAKHRRVGGVAILNLPLASSSNQRCHLSYTSYYGGSCPGGS